MAKRRGSKRLGFSPDRWSVFTVGGRRGKQPCTQSTYTSYGDAAKATLRCSNARNKSGSRKPCLLLSGWSASTPNIVGVCVQGRCREAKESDWGYLARCGVSKRAPIRQSRIRGSLSPSQASKSGVDRFRESRRALIAKRATRSKK